MIPPAEGWQPQPQGPDVRGHDEQRSRAIRAASRTGSDMPTPKRTTPTGSSETRTGTRSSSSDYPSSRVMDVGNTGLSGCGGRAGERQAKARRLRRRVPGRRKRVAALGDSAAGRPHASATRRRAGGRPRSTDFSRTSPRNSTAPACSSSPTSGAPRSPAACGRSGIALSTVPWRSRSPTVAPDATRWRTVSGR